MREDALCASCTFLLSGTVRCSIIILYVACPSTKINHLSKQCCFLLLENSVINQVLGTRCVHFYWGVIDPMPTQLTNQWNIFVYTNVYINISINISTCDHFIWINTGVHSDVSQSNPLPQLKYLHHMISRLTIKLL